MQACLASPSLFHTVQGTTGLLQESAHCLSWLVCSGAQSGCIACLGHTCMILQSNQRMHCGRRQSHHASGGTTEHNVSAGDVLQSKGAHKAAAGGVP